MVKTDATFDVDKFVDKLMNNVEQQIKLNENVSIIKFIQEKLTGSNIKWILVGSTSLALRGVDVIPKDIDILTDEYGSKELDKLLKEYCFEELNYSSTENIQSFFGKYMIDGVQIEVMGNLQSRLLNEEWNPLTDLDDFETCEYQGTIIPVLSLEKEIEGYSRLGREEKVLKIKDRLEELKSKN